MSTKGTWTILTIKTSLYGGSVVLTYGYWIILLWFWLIMDIGLSFSAVCVCVDETDSGLDVSAPGFVSFVTLYDYTWTYHRHIRWVYLSQPHTHTTRSWTGRALTVKKIPPAQQHNYIILWMGREGVRLLNTWGLTDAQLQEPKNVWDKLEGIQPSDNFRIHRLQLQRGAHNRADNSGDQSCVSSILRSNAC